MAREVLQGARPPRLSWRRSPVLWIPVPWRLVHGGGGDQRGSSNDLGRCGGGSDLGLVGCDGDLGCGGVGDAGQRRGSVP